MGIPKETKHMYCNRCNGATKHSILFTKSQHYEELDPDEGWPIYFERHDYYLAECDGCENITLLIESDSNSQSGTYTTQYPPLTIRREPPWLVSLLLLEQIDNPFKYDFMREIYVALRSNNLRLAVIGIRALLEQIMIEKVGDNRSFQANLNKFESEGYISRIQKEAIEPVLEAGHASIHRGFKATKEDVIHLMDITENVIESIYINNLKSERLNVPRRKI